MAFRSGEGLIGWNLKNTLSVKSAGMHRRKKRESGAYCVNIGTLCIPQSAMSFSPVPTDYLKLFV